MGIKKEYLILVAVIVVLALYLILRHPDRQRYELPAVPEVPGKDISRIEISKQGTSISLNKKDGIWHIEPQGYPASADKVKGMLDVLEKLTLTALVSESKDYVRYDLNEDKKITVRAYAGDRLIREFEVGKAAPSYRHTFVKLAGDDRVYHARDNFRHRFDETLDGLRDKKVLAFDKSEIQEIRITKGGQSMVFGLKQIPVELRTTPESQAENPPPSTSESPWQSSDGKEADGSRVNRLLSTLSNLECEKYIDDRNKEAFADPIYTVQLKGSQEYALSIFDKMEKDAKGYPAISSESDYPFLLKEHQANGIMQDPQDMVKRPHTPESPGNK